MADGAARYRRIVRIALGLYAFVCLVVFIWMRFSYDSLKYKIEDVLGNALGGQVTLGHIHPNLLWGFTVDGMQIKGAQVAKKLTISPRPWDFFRGSLGFAFHADLVSGTTEGHMSLPFQKDKKPVSFILDMASVDLSTLSKVFPPSMSPKGSITGELKLSTPRHSLDKAAGNLTLNWKKGTLPLGMASLPFDALVFDNLDLDGRIDNGLLTIEKAEFTGEFSGSMNGSVRFSNDFKRSRLAVTGELNLPEPMKKALGPEYDSGGQGSRFSLRGSIERPRFHMLSTSARRMPIAAPVQDMGAPAQVPQAVDRRPVERQRQEMAAPAPAPTAVDRRAPDKPAAPDESQVDKTTEPEGQ
ncbi:MAG TPA: type II secretion system protein GspN [Desulfomonilia bacterium]|nr:type II secretion system protein GspN [Desulfomonilia bacterium]